MNSHGKKHFACFTAPAARAIMAGAIALALSVFATESSAEYATRYLGGIGGGSYRSPCRPNDVLVGVHIRSGNAVDAITAICSPLNPSRTDWAGETYQPTQAWGGGGGSPKALRCRQGDAVHRLKVQQGPWDIVTVVKGIGLLCGDLDAAHYYEVVQGAQSTVSGSGEVKCNDGDWATGIFGNSGALVDSVGLLCDHIAPATTTTPPSAAATTPPPTADRPDKSMKKGKLVSVEESVDVCRAAGGCDEDTRIAVLEAGTQSVLLLGSCADNWCHVKWPAGEGWVYDGPDYDSLKY